MISNLFHKKEAFFKGNYKGLDWNFFLSKDIKPKLVTAVNCLATYDNSLLIVENAHRGWEFPGGHLEAGETIYQATRREILEEGSCKVRDMALFAYQEFTFTTPQRSYPFPKAQIAYIAADISEVLTDMPSHHYEIKRRKFCSFEEAKELVSEDFQKEIITIYEKSFIDWHF